MSQHDYDIANQTFPSFRSDLNNALKALASLSSGTTAPATTYANQLWYDTANDTLKIRNESNSDWLDLFGIGQSSGNIGIGTKDAGAKLHVDAGSASSVSGRFQNSTTANNCTIDFVNAGSTVTNGTRIGSVADDLWLITSSTERMRISSSGEVQIAGSTDRGAYNLQCNGTGVWGAGAYVNGSDARVKNDIAPIGPCLDTVKNLKPVVYRYKESFSSDQSLQPGFIAQDLQEVMVDKPYVEGIVQGGPEYLNVAYQTLIPVLTKAIQEQQELIDGLKARLDILEAK